MRATIQCIDGQLSSTDAVRVVSDASGLPARLERTLFYPYLWYRCRYTLRTMFGAPRFQSDCLVDGRKGLVSTTDSFETNALRPPEGDVLEISVKSATASAAARRTLSHVLMKKHRVIADIELEMSPSQLLHKKFWVVSWGTDDSRTLVDSTTGQLILLAPDNNVAA